MFDSYLSIKEKLILGVLLLIAVALVIWSEIDYQKSVDECIASGQNAQVCIEGLR